MPMSIQLSEIYAYIKICGDFSNSEALRLVEFIQQMDTAYLDHWFKKHESKT